MDDFCDVAGEEAEGALRGDDAHGGVATIEDEDFGVEALVVGVEGDCAADGVEVVGEEVVGEEVFVGDFVAVSVTSVKFLSGHSVFTLASCVGVWTGCRGVGLFGPILRTLGTLGIGLSPGHGSVSRVIVSADLGGVWRGCGKFADVLVPSKFSAMRGLR